LEESSSPIGHGIARDLQSSRDLLNLPTLIQPENRLSSTEGLGTACGSDQIVQLDPFRLRKGNEYHDWTPQKSLNVMIQNPEKLLATYLSHDTKS
jgi:hypothetical protein